MEQYKQEFIEFMIDCNVLKFGDFTTKSGRKTPFFVNTGFYRTGAIDKDIHESLNFLVISTQFKEWKPRGFPLILLYFTFSLAEIRLCRTDVRRRNGYSTILRIFIYLIT